MNTTDVLEFLENSLRSEGYRIAKEHTPAGGNEFELRIPYPAATPAAGFVIVRPGGRGRISLVLPVQLSPQHAQAWETLSNDVRRTFLKELRKKGLEGGVVGFGPQFTNDRPDRWVLDYSIWDDALTEHTLMTGMRLVFTKHLEILDLVNERLVPTGTGHAAGYA